MLSLPLISTHPDRYHGKYVASMFASGEQGAWYDPSDMSTLFQDSAGTTPVTAVEQPVGRILDKSGRGNHATQSTTTARPVLSALVNLLTGSEFVGAVAGTPGTPPTGWSNGFVTGAISESATGIRLVTNSTRRTINNAFSIKPGGVIVAKVTGVVNTSGGLVQARNIVGNTNPAVIASASYKVNGVAVALNYVMPVGAFGIECTLTASASGGSSVLSVGIGVQGNATGDVTLLTASLTLATDAHLPYQRVNTATDYDAGPAFPRYLKFDGVDDTLVTGNIDFTSTDKMTVLAGVKKNSNAATATLFETSSSIVNNNGTLFFGSPTSTNSYQFNSKGSSESIAGSGSGVYVAPITNVVAGISDISGDSVILRVNGNQVAQSTADQGTGNYGNYPLYIGRRNGASMPFKGHLYGLIVRGAQTDDLHLTNTEKYLAYKTGVTL